MKCAWGVLVALMLAGAPARGDDAASESLTALAGEQVVPSDASAGRVLEICRAMVPSDVVIRGRVNRRSRHGKTIASYSYVLARRGGATNLELRNEKGEFVPVERKGRIADTDVAWDDLTMDFLWWTDVSFDSSAGASSLSGVLCKVLLLKNGARTFRAWIDERTGAMLQAAELREVDGTWKTVREVFCTSLKKFGERWAPRNIEVGPPGAKYRTKIIVEHVEDMR